MSRVSGSFSPRCLSCSSKHEVQSWITSRGTFGSWLRQKENVASSTLLFCDPSARTVSCSSLRISSHRRICSCRSCWKSFSFCNLSSRSEKSSCVRFENRGLLIFAEASRFYDFEAFFCYLWHKTISSTDSQTLTSLSKEQKLLSHPFSSSLDECFQFSRSGFLGIRDFRRPNQESRCSRPIILPILCRPAC